MSDPLITLSVDWVQIASQASGAFVIALLLFQNFQYRRDSKEDKKHIRELNILITKLATDFLRVAKDFEVYHRGPGP